MVQLHVLPLGCCEVVLGTHWLSTLALTIWNFKLLTMEFHHCGQQVVLQGIKVVGYNFQERAQFFKKPSKGGLILKEGWFCSGLASVSYEC